MSIYQDRRNGKPNGWFRVEVTCAGQRARGRARTRAEAKLMEARLLQGLQTPELVRELAAAAGRRLNEPSFGQLLVLAKGNVWRGNKTEATAWHYADRLGEILGDIPLRQITAFRVDDVILYLRAGGYSPASINRFLSALLTLLKWARQRGMVSALPVISRQKEPPGRARTLTLEEEARIYGWFEDRGLRQQADYLRVLVLTGMRRSECLKLQPQDIQGNYARLHGSKTKSGETRSVALRHEVRDILARRLPWKFSHSRLSLLWLAMRKELGLDAELVIHSLRHTFAARLVEAGVPLNVVSVAMGHRYVTSTQRYAHVRDDNVLAAVGRAETVVAAELPSPIHPYPPSPPVQPGDHHPLTTITPKDFDHAEGATRYGCPADFLAPMFVRNGEVFANSQDLAEALWVDPTALHAVIAAAIDGEPELTRRAFLPITHLVDPHGDDQTLAPAVKTYEISVFGLGLLVPHMPTQGDTRGRLIYATNQAVAAATKLREEQQ